jgi:hypothetical protein
VKIARKRISEMQSLTFVVHRILQAVSAGIATDPLNGER